MNEHTCHICNEERPNYCKIFTCANCSKPTCNFCSDNDMVNCIECYDTLHGIASIYLQDDSEMDIVVKHLGFESISAVEDLWGRNIYGMTVRQYDGDYVSVAIHYDFDNADRDYLYDEGKLTKVAKENMQYWNEEHYSQKGLNVIIDDLTELVTDIEDSITTREKEMFLLEIAKLTEFSKHLK
jgi:hypothetical protein